MKYTDKMYMDKPLNISRVYNKHQTCQNVNNFEKASLWH